MSHKHKQAVYDSDLYANEHGRKQSHKRFLLAVIAELTHDSDGCDEHPCKHGGQLSHPGDYDDYDGWCWAGQQTLADRVGVCGKRSINRMLQAMWGDRCFSDLRRYRDKLGFQHVQYRLDMDFINRHKRKPVDMDDYKPVDMDDYKPVDMDDYKPVDMDVPLCVDVRGRTKSRHKLLGKAGDTSLDQRQDKPYRDKSDDLKPDNWDAMTSAQKKTWVLRVNQAPEPVLMGDNLGFDEFDAEDL